jgi:hypothetical protein
MGIRGRTARLCCSVAALCALIAYTIVSAGCFYFTAWQTHFPDMRRQLDALPMPDGYELLAETEEGAPPFSSPVMMRIYRSPQDLDATCDQLQAQFQDRSPTITHRNERGCGLQFRVSSGWEAKLWGIWRYGLVLSVSQLGENRDRLHRDEPLEPYTRVLVSLTDKYRPPGH